MKEGCNARGEHELIERALDAGGSGGHVQSRTGPPPPTVESVAQQPVEPCTANLKTRLIESLQPHAPLLACLLERIPLKWVFAVSLAIMLWPAGKVVYAYRDSPPLTYVREWFTPAMTVSRPRSTLDPPYRPINFVLTNAPDSLSPPDLTLILGDRTLNHKKREFFLGPPQEPTDEGQWLLTIPNTEFDWADEPGKVIDITISYNGDDVYHDTISLAVRPILRLEQDGNTVVLSAPTDMPKTTAQEILLEYAQEVLGSTVPLYLVGPGPVDVVLPAVVTEHPDDFKLRIDDKDLPITNSVSTSLEIDELIEVDKYTCGLHMLRLSYEDRTLSEVILIRYLAPLREKKQGQPWSLTRLTREKAAYWHHDPETDPGTIRASSAVRPGPEDAQIAYSIPFPPPMLVEPGIYIIETNFENIQGCSLCIVFSNWFEVVLPPGVGQTGFSYKLDHELDWPESQRAEALAYWQQSGAKLTFETTTELKFPGFPKGFTLNDQHRHTATLVITVDEHHVYQMPSMEFTVYVDGIQFPTFAAYVSSLPVFTPVIRHRGCVDLVLSNYHIFHLPQ